MTDDLALDRQVCFALYSASRAATAAYRPLLDELGVTYPQYLVLLVLWERDGRGVREICDELRPRHRHPLAAAQTTRGPRPGRAPPPASDERRVEIHLTDAGTALRERAADIPRKLARGHRDAEDDCWRSGRH